MDLLDCERDVPHQFVLWFPDKSVLYSTLISREEA